MFGLGKDRLCPENGSVRARLSISHEQGACSQKRPYVHACIADHLTRGSIGGSGAPRRHRVNHHPALCCAAKVYCGNPVVVKEAQLNDMLNGVRDMATMIFKSAILCLPEMVPALR
jgi:hypothetical protein